MAGIGTEFIQKLSKVVSRLYISFIDDGQITQLVSFDHDGRTLLVGKQAVIADVLAGLHKSLPGQRVTGRTRGDFFPTIGRAANSLDRRQRDRM